MDYLVKFRVCSCLEAIYLKIVVSYQGTVLRQRYLER